MSHMPTNHPLRPLYRAITFLSGAYVLVFGVVGYIVTQGQPFFEPGAERALGLRTNPGFAALSIAVGAAVVLATIAGRNIDRHVAIWAGSIFMIAGTVMMLLMESDMNFLNFTIATCVVSYVIGSALLTAGMYLKTGPRSAISH